MNSRYHQFMIPRLIYTMQQFVKGAGQLKPYTNFLALFENYFYLSRCTPPLVWAPSKVISGLQLASLISDKTRSHLASVFSKDKRIVPPTLGYILVGKNPDSCRYVALKKRACLNVGIIPYGFEVESTIAQTSLEAIIEEMNSDGKVSGIMVQLPLPSQLDPERINSLIRPDKDVDGLHPVNVESTLAFLCRLG